MTDEPEDFQRRKPRQARSRVTYDSILEAAMQLLARDGAGRLTTNRVAERAGVSIGTLYQYFPDKAAILLAAARRELTRPGFLAQQKALMEALVLMVDSLMGGGAAPVPVTVRRRPARKTPAEPNGLERLAAWLLDPAPLLTPVASCGRRPR